MSFAAKFLQQSQGKDIFYVVVEDTRQKLAWYYVKVQPGKAHAFEQALKGPTDLALWGQVLYSGYGEASPSNIRNIMKQKFGFEHQG